MRVLSSGSAAPVAQRRVISAGPVPRMQMPMPASRMKVPTVITVTPRGATQACYTNAPLRRVVASPCAAPPLVKYVTSHSSSIGGLSQQPQPYVRQPPGAALSVGVRRTPSRAYLGSSSRSSGAASHSPTSGRFAQLNSTRQPHVLRFATTDCRHDSGHVVVVKQVAPPQLQANMANSSSSPAFGRAPYRDVHPSQTIRQTSMQTTHQRQLERALGHEVEAMGRLCAEKGGICDPNSATLSTIASSEPGSSRSPGATPSSVSPTWGQPESRSSGSPPETIPNANSVSPSVSSPLVQRALETQLGRESLEPPLLSAIPPVEGDTLGSLDEDSVYLQEQVTVLTVQDQGRDAQRTATPPAPASALADATPPRPQPGSLVLRSRSAESSPSGSCCSPSTPQHCMVRPCLRPECHGKQFTCEHVDNPPRPCSAPPPGYLRPAWSSSISPPRPCSAPPPGIRGGPVRPAWSACISPSTPRADPRSVAGAALQAAVAQAASPARSPTSSSLLLPTGADASPIARRLDAEEAASPEPLTGVGPLTLHWANGAISRHLSARGRSSGPPPGRPAGAAPLPSIEEQH